MYSLTKLYLLNENIINVGLPVILSNNNSVNNLLDYIIINKIHYSIVRKNNIYIILPVVYSLFFIICFSCFIFKN